MLNLKEINEKAKATSTEVRSITLKNKTGAFKPVEQKHSTISNKLQTSDKYKSTDVTELLNFVPDRNGAVALKIHKLGINEKESVISSLSSSKCEHFEYRSDDVTNKKIIASLDLLKGGEKGASVPIEMIDIGISDIDNLNIISSLPSKNMLNSSSTFKGIELANTDSTDGVTKHLTNDTTTSIPEMTSLSTEYVVDDGESSLQSFYSRRGTNSDNLLSSETNTSTNVCKPLNIFMTSSQQLSNATGIKRQNSPTTYNEENKAKRRPKIERYVSQELDGSYKITYKKKMFDKRNKVWRVVEEKVVDKANDEGYPKIFDDVINSTTTTYTTKLYDSKLGEWEVIDKKSFVDSEVFVPNDIAQEIEKDNTDIANITTTTEVTKIFDASINDWRLLDERTHTDVIEKIVDTKQKKVYVDEFIDIKNERCTDIKKNTLNEENIGHTIYDEVAHGYRKTLNIIDCSETVGGVKTKAKDNNCEKCICESCQCGQHHYTNGDVDVSNYLSTSNAETYAEIQTNTSTKSKDSEKKICAIASLIYDDQNERINSSSAGAFHTPEELWSESAEQPVQKKPIDKLHPGGDFYVPEGSEVDLYLPEKQDFQPADRPVKPKDNLKSEGDIIIPENQPYKPAERIETIIRKDNLRTEGEMIFEKSEQYQFVSRPDLIRPTDNLKPEGEFYNPEKLQYRLFADRPDIKKPLDNLRPEGDFYTPHNLIYQPTEKTTQVKPDDNLKSDGEFYTPEKPVFQSAEKPVQQKPIDNLHPEGDFYVPEKAPFQPVERPKQRKPKDNLHPEGELYSPQKQEFQPADRPVQIKPKDNLKSEGDIIIPENQSYKPAERIETIIRKDNLRTEGEMIFEKSEQYQFVSRPDQIRPTDNLKPEGEFYNPEKLEYRLVADRPDIKKPLDNLRPEGDFYTPHKLIYQPAEKTTQVKPGDNLKSEGEFYTPEKPVFQSAEKPVQKKPIDNLHSEGDFYVPEKAPFQPVKRPKQKKPKDNLHPEGELYSPQKQEFQPADRPVQVKPKDNLKPEGDIIIPENQSYKPAERIETIIRKDNLRTEGEMIFEKSEQYQFVSRPDQIRPTDNLKPEGEFYNPEKLEYRLVADCPDIKKPVDNLRPEGDFYTPHKLICQPSEKTTYVNPGKRSGLIEGADKLKSEKSIYCVGKGQNVTLRQIKSDSVLKSMQPRDNLSFEACMGLDKKSNFDIDKKKPSHSNNHQLINNKTKYSHNKSSINLGNENSIMKTTNQICFASAHNTFKENLDIKKPADGLVVVSTKQVTTVIGSKNKKESKTEYIKEQKKVNIMNNLPHISDLNNIKNIKKDQQVRESILGSRIVDQHNFPINGGTQNVKSTCFNENVTIRDGIKLKELRDTLDSASTRHLHHRRSDLSSDSNITNTLFNPRNGTLTSNGKNQRKNILNLHEQQPVHRFPNERQSYSSIHRQKKELESKTHSSEFFNCTKIASNHKDQYMKPLHSCSNNADTVSSFSRRSGKEKSVTNRSNLAYIFKEDSSTSTHQNKIKYTTNTALESCTTHKVQQRH